MGILHYQVGDEIEISKIFPIVLKKLFNNFSSLKDKQDYYLICPFYKDGDTQIGITGKGKLYEHISDSLQREVMEETSIIITPETIIDKIHFRKQGNNLGIISCSDKFSYQKSENINTKDNTQVKIGAFILTNLDLNFPVNLIDSDDIEGITFIKYDQVYRFIKSILL